MSETMEHFLYALKYTKSKHAKKYLVTYHAAACALKNGHITYDELAVVLDVPVATATSRIRRACVDLGLEREGLVPLRGAYIEFLEEEIKVYTGE